MLNNKYTLALALFLGLFYNANAATRTSTGNGLWSNTATWSGGVVPTCGDSVVIQSGHTVSVTSQQNYTGCGSILAIVIQGKLYFVSGNKLRLPCNSRIYIYSGGTLDSDGSGSSNQIEICGTQYWNGSDGPVFGPRCFPATSCGTVIPTICSYGYRKRITIDHTKVSGAVDLTNFPVLVSIATDTDLAVTGSGGYVTSASGFDICFTEEDGMTPLSFQRERYVSGSGLYTAWVKLPIVYTNKPTYFYMYYGNSAVTTDQSSQAVWSNYYGAWHFQTNSVADNSSNANNFTSNSTSSTSSGFINDARSGSTGWLELSAFPNLTTNFVISAWINTNDKTKSGQRIFCDDVNNSGGYAFSLGDASQGRLRFFSRGVSGVTLDGPNNINNGTWYHVAAVADITNSTRTIYLNGVSVANDIYTGSWGTDNGNASAMGETASGETSLRFDGKIDELHVCKSTLTADWLLTEYNNQSAPASFYSIAATPKVWTGGTSTAWTTGTNWLGSLQPAAGNDVIINNGSNQPSMSASLQANSLFIRTGATLSLGGNSLFISSDIANCGLLSGATGLVSMNGGTANIQTQNISGSGTYNLNNLTINNTYSTSPEVLLNTPVSVSGALALTSGIVTTNSTNLIAMSSTATSGAGSASSYVNGPMTKTGVTAFVFPVGKGGAWARVGISVPTATATFRGEYFNSAYTSSSPVNSPLTYVSTLEYWQLDRLAGSGDARVTLYWEDATGGGINSCPDLTIARWNGSSWDERTATAAGTCTGAGTGSVTTNSNITAFSPFTFGSRAGGGINPLPVQLTAFSILCEGGTVKLSWSTASELNNDHFTIERTTDGEQWQLLETIKAKGGASMSAKYNASIGDNGGQTTYYRLSQVDADGRVTIFRTLASSCLSSQTNLLSFFPNPSNGAINLDLDLTSDHNDGKVRIFDKMGRLCFTKAIDMKKGRNLFNLEMELAPGIYTMMVNSKDLTLPVKKMVIE